MSIPTPTPKQAEFLRARTRYVCYGGARGGGKSHAVRTKALLMSCRYPGLKSLIIRRTYPELYENHILEMIALTANGLGVYRDKDKSIRLLNGSRIKFGYCDTDADALQYQGQEYDILYIDEATQITELQFTWLDATVRGTNDYPKRTYMTCNPGGVGHDFIKTRFVQADDPDVTYIQARVYDNEPLMRSNPGYLKTLENLPEGLREAWLDGNWDSYVGQYFGEFDRALHVVEPFAIPDYWRIYRTIDYGLDMLACLWIAVDELGGAWVIQELHQPNMIISDAAAAIIDASQHVQETYLTLAPPDLWARSKDSGKTISDVFGDSGLPLYQCGNARAHGWLNVKEYLKPIQGQDGDQTSRLKIFSSCHNLIRNLPLLQRDPKKPDDCATEPHDITHICDALRYYCHHRPVPAHAPDTRTSAQAALDNAKKRAITGDRGTRRARW